MRKKNLSRLMGGGIALAAICSAAGAQDRPEAAPPPPTDLAAEPGVDPVVQFLAETQGISTAEARERRDVMDRVNALIAPAQTESPATFAGVWVEHQPVFKVVVAFADKADRSAFTAALDPALRRHVQIRTVRAGLQQQQAELDAIFDALRGERLDFSVAFDPKNQKYEVAVAERTDVQGVMAMIPPQLRSLVIVRRGPIPVDAQTNVTPGDRVHAGWDALTAQGYHNCTFGFAGVNVNNRPAISTAGHCTAQQPTVVKATNPEQLVTLPPPFAERHADTYDFQLHEAVGLDPGYWVWFKNSKPVRGFETYVNTVSGYYSDGYFTVAGSAPYQIGNGQHWVDRPVCKYGSRTGFTCGYVSGSYVSGVSQGRAFSGMVRVNRTKQQVIAFSGDSGGPVFSPPNSQYDTVALGLVKATEAHQNADGTLRPCVTGTGYDCGYFYMPIDRIDHDGRFDLYTTGGLVRP